MSTFKRPGVYVQETLNPSFAVSSPSLATACFLGQMVRGPVVPTLVESWAEYVQRFGAFDQPTYLAPFSIYEFFAGGGQRAWIQRVVGTGNLIASRSFVDQQATPASTFTIYAANPGAWGNNVYVAISQRVQGVDASNAAADRFDLTVYYGGQTDAYIVERFTDLSMVTSDSRYAPSQINNVVSGSNYITMTDLLTGRVPAVIAASAGSPPKLSGGADGSNPSSGDYQTAITGLSVIDEPFGINIPGSSDTTVLAAAINFADPALGGRGDAFVVIDPPSGATPSTAITFLRSLPASGYGAVYYPWLYAADPAAASATAVRLLPPGGFVLGQYAATDAGRGVFKAPAGVGNRLAGVASLERKFTSTDLDNLNDAQVNAIRDLPGAGICIMGARTLRTTPLADRFVNVRRTLIFLKRALLDATAYAVFENNDEALWTSLRNATTQFLLSFWQGGGLSGRSANEAFFVQCDASNNTQQAIEAGEVHIDVGVALQRPAEFIVIKIGQWSGGQSAIEL